VSKRSLRSKFAVVCAVAGAALIVPTMASAATLYVSPNTPSAPFDSCTHPNYRSIQKAVEAPSTAITVCAGTYTEQVQITKAVSITALGGATLELPASPVNSTTACDTAIPTLPPSEYRPNRDELSICTAGTVSISGLKIKALWPEGTCYDSLYGVFVAGGGTLKATNDTIIGAGASPINGCQGGVAVEVGTARTEPSEVGHATFTDDTVSGYQKNGITDEGAGTSINVSSTTVTGAGATPAIAQNGIQISFGASGTITKSTITGNECDNAACSSDSLAGTQATGVLFIGAANGSSVSKSHINGNDVGVYTESETETEPTEPAAPQIVVKQNTLESDRYESILVSQGWASLTKNKLIGGNVGIQLLQTGSETYGPKATALKDKISGMSVWAVQGRSDNEPSDPFGSITIAKSHLSENPGPTVAESVESDNVAKLKVITSKDS
jgi:hypothetical protein